MRFGLYSSIANPPRGEHLERSIDEVIAEAQQAEASGFDSCFFGEHHQDADGFLPSPLIVATAVAAHTRRLRVGTSVILLPLHHPVRVAEDAVTLDLVSKGRVVLGVGIGYQPADFRAFSVPMEHRVALFEESVQIIRKCWAGEPVLLSRQALHPGRRADPPAAIPAAGTAPVDRRQRPRRGAPRGTHGRRLCRHPNHAPHTAPGCTSLENAVRQVDAYKEAARQAGRPAQVVLMRDAWAARTRAEAEAVYGPEVMAAYRYYWQNRLAEFRSIPAGTEFTLGNLAPDRLVLGDPETCVREFHRWRDATGADYFLLRLRHAHSGGPPHEKIKRYGATLLGSTPYPLGSAEFSALLPKIQAAKPEVLLAVTPGADAVAFLKQAISFGMKKEMRIVTRLHFLFYAKEGGGDLFSDIYGGTSFYWELAETIPQAKRFLDTWQKRFGLPPDAYGAYGFSGIMEVARGVELAKSTDSEAVARALRANPAYDHYKGKQWWRACDNKAFQDMWIIKGRDSTKVRGEWGYFEVVQKVPASEELDRTCAEKGLA